MNKARRSQIEKAKLLYLDATAKLDECREIIYNCFVEEAEYYGNMPESFQNGEKGATTQQSIVVLENILDYLEDFLTGEHHFDEAKQ